MPTKLQPLTVASITAFKIANPSDNTDFSTAIVRHVYRFNSGLSTGNNGYDKAGTRPTICPPAACLRARPQSARLLVLKNVTRT